MSPIRTMLTAEALTEKGELRFTLIDRHMPGISYKMLAQTLRSIGREGLMGRTLHPVRSPKVVYKLSGVGLSLSAGFSSFYSSTRTLLPFQGNLAARRQSQPIKRFTQV